MIKILRPGIARRHFKNFGATVERQYERLAPATTIIIMNNIYLDIVAIRAHDNTNNIMISSTGDLRLLD